MKSSKATARKPTKIIKNIKRAGSKKVKIGEKASPKKSLAQMASILETMGDGFIMMDGEFIIHYINKRAEHLLDKRRQDLSGYSFFDVFPQLRGSLFEEKCALVLREKTPLVYETYLTVGPSNNWYDIGIYPLFDGIAVHFRVITQRKRAEAIQSAIYKISEATSEVSSLQELYHSIHLILSALMPTDNFYIALHDITSDEITFPYFVDQHDESPGSTRIGRGATEYVLRTGQPLLAPPEVFDALEREGEVELVGAPSVDWLGVPLKIGERVIGVLVVQSYTEGVRFNKEDLDILTFVSNQVAISIERKRSEEKMRRMTEEWVQTFDSITDMIFIQDRDFTITKVNRAFSDFMKVPPDQLVGRKCFQLLHGTNAPHPECPFEKTRADTQSHTEEVNDPHIGIPLLVTTSPIFGERGEFIGSVHISKDISELKQAEGKLAAIYDLSREISSTMDLSKIFERILVGCQRVFDFKMIAISLIDEETQELYIKTMVGHPEEVLRVRFPLTAGEGIMAWVATHGESLIVPDVSYDPRYVKGTPHIETKSELAVPLMVGEKVIGVLNVESETLDAFTEDDRRLLEILSSQTAIAIENARLLESEKQSARKAENLLTHMKQLFEISHTITQLTSLQETLDTIVCAITDSGTWRRAVISLRDEKGFFNRYAFAGVEEENIQKAKKNPVPPSFRTKLFDERARISRSYYHTHDSPTIEALESISTPSIIPPEEFVDWHPEDLLIIPFYDKSGTILGYLSVDEPTDGRRPTEESIKILETFANNAAVAIENARLFTEVANSGTLKEMFISIISHDLKNPLTVIRGYNELLGGMVDEKARLYVRKIEDGVMKMNAIIDEARLYSRIKDEGYMRDFEEKGVGEIIASAIESISEKASRNNISLSFEMKNPPVRAHKTLENVFLNLIDNAIKYSPPGTSVEIGVEENNVVRVWVKDSGKGIPDEFKDMIFEKFERGTVEGIEGSGLGLAIAKEIVRRHSGRIWVENNFPCGSIFYVELPKMK